MAGATRTIIFLALVCAVIAGAAGCGGEAAPLSSSTSTTAPSADAAAAEAIQVMADYTKALKAWFEDYTTAAEDGGEGLLDFRDPMSPTDAEIAKARQFTEYMRSSLKELKAIGAPAEVARAHSQLYSALSGELDALDRYISALDWQSGRDAELAYRDAEEAYTLFWQAIGALSPYVDLAEVIES